MSLLEEIINDSAKAKIVASNGRSFVIENFSSKILRDKWKLLLKNVTNFGNCNKK